MSNEGSSKSKFFTFNAGHLLSIIIYIITFAYYAGIQANTLKEHDAKLMEHSLKIEELKKSDMDFFTQGSFPLKTQQLAIQSLEFRTTKIEASLVKIDVLANDMDWLKKWLTTQENKAAK